MMRRVTDLTIASAWACLLLPVAIGPHSHAWGEEPRATAGPVGPAAPVRNGLELWVKSDDLVGLKPGDRIGAWPDSSGRKRHLTSTGSARPIFKADGIAGHSTVVFAGDLRSDPKVAHFFGIPLEGEWRGTSVFAVGKGLTGAGWFDSAPEATAACAMSYLQLTGSRAGNEGFKSLGDPARAGLAEMLVGMDERGAMTFTAYVNGRVEGRPVRDEGAEYGVIFRDARIGVNNRGETAFAGELAELLIYRGLLPEADRLAVERYLMAKYGMAAATPEDPEDAAGTRAGAATPSPSSTRGAPPVHPGVAAVGTGRRPQRGAGRLALR